MRTGFRTAAAALALALVAIPASAEMVIDEFNDGTLDLRVPKDDGSSTDTSTESGLNVIGGERKTTLTLQAYPGYGEATVSLTTGGALSWSNSSFVSSRLTLVYGASAALGADFSAEARIILDVVNLPSGSVEVDVTLTDSEDNSHTETLTATEPAPVAFPLTDYATAGVDLSAVDTITVVADAATFTDMVISRLSTAAKAEIGDRVWLDTNPDNVQGVGEITVNDVQVELYACDEGGNPVGDPLDTTYTSGGQYYFRELEPGKYAVHFVAPEGYNFVTKDVGDDDTIDSDADASGWTTCIDLAATEKDYTWDAGLVEDETPPPPPPDTASIGDLVWDDLDEDGIQDEGEPGVPGVTVKLYDCEGNLVATTTTDEDGTYSFDDLPPEGYCLLFVRPIGKAFTLRDQGADDTKDSDAERATGYTAGITLLPGQDDDTWDAGLVEGDDEPYGGGKWKNTDPDDWPVDGLRLGDEYYHVDDLVVLMDRPPKKGDARIILAHQLIPAMLSVANGADPSGVADLIAAANGWLIAYPLPAGPLPPADWEDPPPPPKGADRDAMIELAELLDDWNSS